MVLHFLQPASFVEDDVAVSIQEFWASSQYEEFEKKITKFFSPCWINIPYSCHLRL